MSANLHVIRMGSTASVIADEAGKQWLKENAETELWQWAGRRLAVEPRFLPPLLDAARGAGLTVAD